jgi:hypothetical protein
MAQAKTTVDAWTEAWLSDVVSGASAMSQRKLTRVSARPGARRPLALARRQNRASLPVSAGVSHLVAVGQRVRDAPSFFRASIVLEAHFAHRARVAVD